MIRDHLPPALHELFTLADIVQRFSLTPEQTTQLQLQLRGRAVRVPYQGKGQAWFRWSVIKSAMKTIVPPSERHTLACGSGDSLLTAHQLQIILEAAGPVLDPLIDGTPLREILDESVPNIRRKRSRR
jgi:hypothetical protein